MSDRPVGPAPSRIVAVLGPTNTGKTHLAVERMLGHASGMIGLPLRLLAREIYDRIVVARGARSVALITGEEKIVPPRATYFVCTVEAMPLTREVEFLAIDEIQLCADPERGHVFTQRLLSARGKYETMFLGAATMAPLIRRLLPGVEIVTRERFSKLSYEGPKKITRLPRRTAVVAFSAAEVYAIAELIRRQRGGAAVVMGSLSPRTRNAQVALYQSGEVDFLVATDAIGMGLNMDVDHVAFAALDKFDGVGIRPLRPEEIGQIAGRAGRHMNDGTFGVTAEAEPLDEEIVARVEGHRYDPVRVLQWRNSALDFHSIDGLIASLDEPPPVRGLARARPASDLIALRHLSQMDDVRALARAPAGVRRLWEVCQIPDFRKLNEDEHARLVHTIFGFLMSDDGVLPDDWLARQIERLNIAEGDVATLSGRLAQIRTWTYTTHRPGWMRDAGHWQEVTRAVEDRLSDALHEQLTQRFIDRRTSVLMKHLREDETPDLKLDDSGGVIIGGEAVGKLDGFRFAPDPRAEGIHGRTLRAAAIRGLEGEFFSRARKLGEADDKAFTLSEHGRIWWDGAVVARLVAGAAPLAPIVSLVADEHLKSDLREGVQRRLDSWLEARIAARLEPLIALRNAADAKAGTPGALPGFARGVAHQLAENFGVIDRATLSLPDDLRNLIRALRPFGVWFGRRTVYLPKLLRPEAASLLGLLWGVREKLEQIPTPPLAGLTSFEIAAAPYDFLAACGFRVVARRALRFDMLERLEDELEKGAANGATADVMMPKLVSLLGCGNDELREILGTLGWRILEVADAGTGVRNVWRRAPARARPARREKEPKRKPTPTAASLADLAARFTRR